MPVILAELRCCVNRHVNNRQAFGWRSPSGAPGKLCANRCDALWFPRNGLCSLDRFIIRTPWPKQVRLLVGHYLLLRLHRPLYRDTCTDVWYCTACGIAIHIAMLASRYNTHIAGPSIAMHRCFVTGNHDWYNLVITAHLRWMWALCCLALIASMNTAWLFLSSVSPAYSHDWYNLVITAHLRWMWALCCLALIASMNTAWLFLSSVSPAYSHCIHSEPAV